MSELSVSATAIDGLLVVSLPVHGDNRGWFKENWQREKMVALGLPDFGPVQQNVSFNARAGAVRGLHAEPWDKLVSVLTGRVFGAWVDLRSGPGFGRVVTHEVDAATAVFVPRGVANGFQVLEDATAYSYLVNDHWSAAARDSYVFVNLADPALGIDWPLPLGEMSDADRAHPPLSAVEPVAVSRPVVLGAGGQVGRGLAGVLPAADFLDHPHVDLSSPASVRAADWSSYDLIVNAAAYTAVDLAETPEGRRDAWAVNVAGVGTLVDVARARRATLVHASSDYVFDGTVEEHDEEEPFSPLGVYGQTKAAGDALVSSLPRHYLLRTSWVVGEGKNFVRTMASLADSGACPAVVDDQVGRLTFASEIARAIEHLTSSRAPFGTYNLTCSGPAASWADIAAAVFEARGRSASDVRRVSTADWAATATGPVAPRPQHSTLALEKISATGFTPRDWRALLRDHLAGR
ncbi:MAG TPA: bifunctional dTDP-4-dehydrorhamnose 3,5-epimerase family protein/NAD(P)-dependent oxidoreductase [Marmoricola sp.]|nr:bifunctional dTDP-4-dehydrorhamnose 3,5-epimerase family protein/NAD(P)-dependent oxidoreductase [Marmoricola sp.]